MTRNKRIRAFFARRIRSIADWIAFRAWQYGRKREFARRQAWTTLPQTPAEELTPDQRRILAAEAVNMLENRHFIWAWQSLSDYIEHKALSCDPKDHEAAKLVVISKQLLQALRREFERKAEDGYMAKVEIEQLERRNRLTRLVR